ncbi:S15/NS1 RNA-binding domain-containing protein [Fistulina hepatica ATCC 64428]|uniref:S15/NS1 RNA-binding domain-containing protein n=1 Tax=Fistulina hepatica ATCC 64428 TaxID=1128425 RepID=A0A0D7AJI8_9AGAR|nr:S15/NS1 RNA-binding domain-containing protein [Fistulina hepatica ATCC 64428]
MLRSCFGEISRLVASSSRAAASSSRRSLHTTAVQYAQTANARARRKSHGIFKEERQRMSDRSRPHVVLGLRPGEESKWEKSDLARCLVQKEELEPIKPDESYRYIPDKHSWGTVAMPPTLAFGVGEEERRLLFDQLPVASARMYAIEESIRLAGQHYDKVVSEEEEKKRIKVELQKANHLARMVDLRLANAAGIAYENRRRIIAEFSDHTVNPFDPGRSEVQAALLTYRIRNMWNHLTRNKRDIGNRRALRRLVHQRAKILKYLRRTAPARHDILLERLAVEPQSVQGELII